MENKQPREGWIEVLHEGNDSEGRFFLNCDMYTEPVEGLTHIREVMLDDEFERGEKEGFKKAVEMLRSKEARESVGLSVESAADWLEDQIK